jgi:transcriptional regulator with XRE-family HTH domain
MQELATALLEIMAERGLNQADLAAEAKVNQSTVCRALKRPSKRLSRAQKRLYEYARVSPYAHKEEDGTRSVLKAFERIWDRSEEQALAVAKVIDALGSLCVHVESEKGGGLEGRRQSTTETPEKSRPE